jgi:hypothetical protein
MTDFHMLHFGDTNEVQRMANDRLLDELMQIFNPLVNMSMLNRYGRFTRTLREAQAGTFRPPPLQSQGAQAISHLDFSIRDLLLIIPVERWPRTEACFACPIPHCNVKGICAGEHCRAHEAPFEDNLFTDPFMMTLSALLGWRLRLSNYEEHPCPFCGLGCDFKSSNIDAVNKHVQSKQDEDQKLFLACLGTFWGPVMYYVKTRASWPIVREVMAKRIRREESYITPLSYEDSMRYWYRSAGSEDEHERTYVPSVDRPEILDAPTYPLPKLFTLHFTSAGDEDRSRSEAIFDAIEQEINQNVGMVDRIPLSNIRTLLQRPRSDASSSQAQPARVRDMNMTVRELLTMIPPGQWPRPGPDLPCPNPHCNQCIEATSRHLHEHSEIFEDGMFHDPLITTLSGLIG